MAKAFVADFCTKLSRTVAAPTATTTTKKQAKAKARTDVAPLHPIFYRDSAARIHPAGAIECEIADHPQRASGDPRAFQKSTAIPPAGRPDLSSKNRLGASLMGGRFLDQDERLPG
jgi:hypothetical protein